MRWVPYKVVKRFIRRYWTQYGIWTAGMFKLSGEQAFELHDTYGLHPDFLEHVIKADMRRILSMRVRMN